MVLTKALLLVNIESFIYREKLIAVREAAKKVDFFFCGFPKELYEKKNRTVIKKSFCKYNPWKAFLSLNGIKRFLIMGWNLETIHVAKI